MNNQLNQHTVALLSALIISLLSCSTENKQSVQLASTPVLVHLETPTQRFVETIKVSGQVEAWEAALISTRVMGFISSIKVNTGERVQKGQLLVTINNSDILAKRAQVNAMIFDSEAALKDAQVDYERFEKLYQKQSASVKEFERARLHYNSAAARVETARQMQNESAAMLAYTNLVAPFSGVITQKNSNEGSMANPGMPILTIEQIDRYKVRAFVSANEVGKVKSGMHAAITVKSSGQKLTGIISEISPSSQFTGGEYQLKIALPSETRDVLSGMYVDVSIPLVDDPGVKSLFVPSSAIVRKDQLFGLYTVSDESTAHLRWIRIGREYGGEVEILSGLQADEKFIAKSDGRLFSGAPVLVK